MKEAINKLTGYLNKLVEEKKVVIEKDDVNSVVESVEAFLSTSGYNYNYSENMADQVLIIVL
ncbi:hypothetical protein P5808_30085 [Bacillus cereus]|uniref:hypothetical protein n=1 Tax=Bacillus cereus group TaxID=86661 RepID=UPI002405260D|nr:hypothetical protein [Bacillus cereus]MDF9507407.1 hypothetical protein [Bacillus cereus]MDF9598139.1 hypothetical protein [Bacillus cereus]MDF9609689.1 hypothetical protein [Bacillus cereus]MDF9660699.1 hypothetical protein [Bacillus cereus]